MLSFLILSLATLCLMSRESQASTLYPLTLKSIAHRDKFESSLNMVLWILISEIVPETSEASSIMGEQGPQLFPEFCYP